MTDDDLMPIQGPVQRDATGAILMSDGFTIRAGGQTITRTLTPSPAAIAEYRRIYQEMHAAAVERTRAPRWAMAEWGRCTICNEPTRAVWFGIEHRHMWHAHDDVDIVARKRPNRHDQSRRIRDHRRPQVQGIKARRRARYYGVEP